MWPHEVMVLQKLGPTIKSVEIFALSRLWWRCAYLVCALYCPSPHYLHNWCVGLSLCRLLFQIPLKCRRLQGIFKAGCFKYTDALLNWTAELIYWTALKQFSLLRKWQLTPGSVIKSMQICQSGCSFLMVILLWKMTSGADGSLCSS